MSGPTPPTPAPPLADPSDATAKEETRQLHNLLGDMHEEMAAAANEAELVAAAVPYAERHGAQALRLFYVHYDENKVPVAAQLVASWQPGSQALPTHFERIIKLEYFGLGRLCLENPHQICVIPDLASDPRVSTNEKQLSAQNGHAALAILPCYSRNTRTWQAMLCIFWPTVHTPKAEELYVYGRMSRMLNAFIASRRAIVAHEEMLAELKVVNAVSVLLNAAQSIEQALHAIATPFIDRGADSALWSVIHTRPDGQPEEVEVLATWQRGPATAPSLTGQRRPVTSVPLWQVWTSEPDKPILVANLFTDDRYDEAARAIMKERQRSAIIILPLRRRGRWVGAITISWIAPQIFTGRDYALCQSLASQAAVVFDNRRLMERMQDTVREHQRQSLALKALLDNMPVGVIVLEAQSQKTEIINPKAIEILGGSLAPAPDLQSLGKGFQRYAVGSERLLGADEVPLGMTLADGQPHHMELEVVRPDGVRLSLEVFSAPIGDESGVMRSAMSLFVDVSGRRRSEAERGRIQEELIAFQAAALAERSTPLIPLSDEIMVLPLIGSLDTERGQQVLDVLLEGVSQTRTRVAIIDVTGVRTLDTEAAKTLTQAAQALRLLGVEPVLTGIRAEVAQTLVGLGVPLAGIATRSTLQNGIAYANRKKAR